MNKAQKAMLEMREMDELASMSSFVHRMSPLSKLMMTIVYIAVTASFNRYDLTGLVFMVIFPVILYQMGYVPVSTCFIKLRGILPLILAVGILNPFFDRATVMKIGSLEISGGVISMITLMMKGVFSLMFSFLLMATTRIDELCRGLRKIHFPRAITSLLLLTYRYSSVLLREVSNMTDAYHLRAPGQKGIHISAWGTFLGQLLLRTMDRGDSLYNAMVIRGFSGEFLYAGKKEYIRCSMIMAVIVCGLMILSRFYNIPAIIAGVFIK